MSNKNLTPLGYVSLVDGDLAIFPMNDIFVNFAFQHIGNWEALRLAINILIERYQQEKPDTLLTTIDGEIDVKTRFKHLIGKDTNAYREQDIKITEIKKSIFFIEFQNTAYTDPSIPDRSGGYFGLAIGIAQGKQSKNENSLKYEKPLPTNQIWLMAEPLRSVLHGKMFTRYVLKDEITGKNHPESSGIMFVDLARLSGERSQAGELAALFLGKNLSPLDEDVRKVAAALTSSFKEFKDDKDVIDVLTLAERYEGNGLVKGIKIGKAEGRAEGRAEGALTAADRFLELLKQGISPNQAHNIVTSEFASREVSVTS